MGNFLILSIFDCTRGYAPVCSVGSRGIARLSTLGGQERKISPFFPHFPIFLPFFFFIFFLNLALQAGERSYPGRSWLYAIARKDAICYRQGNKFDILNIHSESYKYCVFHVVLAAEIDYS